MGLPFIVEYSWKEKNGRCKVCGKSFQLKKLRFGVMTQSRSGDHKYPYWYHTGCALKRFEIVSIDHIHNFESIEYEDQMEIMTAIYPDFNYDEIAEKRKAANDEPNALKNYGVEKMTVDRGSCISCKEKFQRDDVIVMRIVFDSKHGRGVKWNHLECFATKRKFLRYELSGIYLPGFDQLDEDGQEMVNDLLPSIASAKKADELLKNHKKYSDFSNLSKVELELLIASQTDDLTKVLKGLAKTVKTLGKTVLQEFLKANGSAADGNYTTLLNRCADFLTFGAIEWCLECGKGDMIFTKHGYTCNAMKSEFIPCANFKKNPKRSLCVIPRELADCLSKTEAFLVTCNLVVSNRAVRKNENIAFDYKTIFDDEAFKAAEPEKNLKFKNGTAVDPESGKQEEAHVYKEDEFAYSTVLNLVDIESDKNSFFTMQVLQSDSNENEFWLFTNSGRTGTNIKKSETTAYKSAQEACDKFEEIFKDKTGHKWASKKKFKKRKGKFFVVDVEYEDAIIINQKVRPNIIDKLVNLMKVLFNVQTMERAMKEYKLDLKKMPLGKLSTKQLKKAQKTLIKLEDAIAKNQQQEIIGLTNKFFTLVPHCIGSAEMPLLDTKQKINDKKETLKGVMDMQVAHDIMKQAPSDQNSFEAFYHKLDAEILPVERDSDDFKLIEKYATNTALGKKFDIVEIFKVERKVKKKDEAKFKALENRMLLWHGSGTANFASIITKGLTIGNAANSMFGNGIYFAEMFCKSLRYCKPDASGIHLIALCEVALGKIKEYKSECKTNPLPPGYQSVKGLGQTHPNPQEAVTRVDGCVIPLGKKTATNVDYTGIDFGKYQPLLFHEYVVYNEDQVNIHYLVQIKCP